MHENQQAAVLVVDDEPQNIALTVELLRRMELAAKIYSAPNGQVALELARQYRPRLVLTDWDMPVMDGLELTLELQSGATTRDIPIIMITGVMTEAASMQEAFYAGVRDFLRRPFAELEFFARIRNTLELQESLDALRRHGAAIEAKNEQLRDAIEEQRILHRQKDEILEELEAKNEEILRAEAQLVHAEKMTALGQLVAGVAHEINNPVNFIVSGLPMMREDFEKVVEHVRPERRGSDFEQLRQSFVELADAVVDGAERTAGIVDGLRSFARLDEAARKTVDLEAALEATLRLIRHRTDGRIEVERRYGGLPPVECYAGELNQVFMNLLINAVQAIDGRGTITITTGQLGDGRAQVSIRDSGQGMDEAVRGQIFDPFFTTKPVGEGTGLGLSISHGIIERHGGTIEVESAAGAGSVFTIILPLEVTAGSPADAEGIPETDVTA